MTAIIDKHGKLLHIVQGNLAMLKLNTPEGCIAVEDPPSDNCYYDNGWKALPSSPHSNYIFDYTIKDWIDPRTLEQAKADAWNDIKYRRDELEFGGFEYNGNIYDSDQVSQGRIMGAANAGVDQTWTLADNSTVDLTADELKKLYVTLQQHISSAHERGRLARQAIDQAATIPEVEAITL